MEPIKHSYQAERESLMEMIANALQTIGYQKVGQNHKLGHISFKNNGKIYYAHIIDMDSDTENRVAVAPGLPNLKKKKINKEIEQTIKRLFRELDLLVA